MARRCSGPRSDRSETRGESSGASPPFRYARFMAEGDPTGFRLTEPAETPLELRDPPGQGGEPMPAPSWMDGTLAPSRVRTGVTPNPRSGLHGALFLFGLVALVGLAGLVGVSLWGPEKQVTSRNHFASDPPPATSLPSLPAEPSADPAASAPAAEPAPSEPSPEPAPPKKRRRQKGSGNR